MGIITHIYSEGKVQGFMIMLQVAQCRLIIGTGLVCGCSLTLLCRKHFGWFCSHLTSILSRFLLHIYRTGQLLYPDHVATDHFESVCPVQAVRYVCTEIQSSTGCPSTVMACHEGSAFSGCPADLTTVFPRLRIINTSYLGVSKSYAP